MSFELAFFDYLTRYNRKLNKVEEEKLTGGKIDQTVNLPVDTKPVKEEPIEVVIEELVEEKPKKEVKSKPKNNISGEYQILVNYTYPYLHVL